VRKALFVLTAAVGLWLAPGALAAGWCGGSGESSADRPDAITGAQIHAIVATPADAPDNFAADANRLADDVASMAAWWSGQDGTRVPRFDLATFGGVTCPDISFVRLPEGSASFSGASTSFDLVYRDLAGAGFFNPYKDYYVFFDGPSVQENVCGTGGGAFNHGGSEAIVWLAGCPGVPTDSVGTHELLHALGALPAGAPHACPGDNGHPCDSSTDLLYPTTAGQPLSQQVLDFNHDDYYAHSGTWDDIQDSIFLRHLNTPEVALSLLLTGAGSVTSDLPGVACSAACTTQWDQGTPVTLSATPATGQRFVRWSGGCAGNGSCALSLAQAATVTAVFGPLTIPVKVSTAGKGKVACTPACSTHFSAGDSLRLRAVPAKGWRFTGWAGACTGARLTCSPHTDAAVTVRATFKKKR
jgi:hypothetical protein